MEAFENSSLVKHLQTVEDGRSLVGRDHRLIDILCITVCAVICGAENWVDIERLSNMFEHDRSAARGVMAVRKLWVFKHKSKWGNAPAPKFFERITVSAKNQTPRAFGDYRYKFDSTDFPEGVTMIEKV